MENHAKAPMPLYRLVLFTVCLVFGAVLILFGIYAICAGGSWIILCGGLMFVMLGFMVRFPARRR